MISWIANFSFFGTIIFIIFWCNASLLHMLEKIFESEILTCLRKHLNREWEWKIRKNTMRIYLLIQIQILMLTPHWSACEPLTKCQQNFQTVVSIIIITTWDKKTSTLQSSINITVFWHLKKKKKAIQESSKKTSTLTYLVLVLIHSTTICLFLYNVNVIHFLTLAYLLRNLLAFMIAIEIYETLVKISFKDPNLYIICMFSTFFYKNFKNYGVLSERPGLVRL